MYLGSSPYTTCNAMGLQLPDWGQGPWLALGKKGRWRRHKVGAKMCSQMDPKRVVLEIRSTLLKIKVTPKRVVLEIET